VGVAMGRCDLRLMAHMVSKLSCDPRNPVVSVPKDRALAMLHLTAVNEIPHRLRALCDAGTCTVHESGVFGVDAVVLGAMVLEERTARRSLARSFSRWRRSGEWVLV
jgi:hypothetical protein